MLAVKIKNVVANLKYVLAIFEYSLFNVGETHKKSNNGDTLNIFLELLICYRIFTDLFTRYIMSPLASPVC